MRTFTTTTQFLQGEIPVTPEEVWTALTTAESTARFFYGIALESDWRTGSDVTGRLGETVVLEGQVLLARRPIRLSYVLFDRPGQPEVFVTWDLRPSTVGTAACLSVDEHDADVDSNAEMEAAWRPVISDLRSQLALPNQDGSKHRS